ncbi:hypothetical protein [Leptolinea tardivitalis]|uniref:BioF2-like acetyltransferase domain-containing protein n=1 Tax=Leptolinea tardivitalis TaxID=229920 RepID=A0A0P6WUT5_9CHLR|nr:hypothetical protein [Leptolinea tardivitalis]KPL74020.1 hypothetical protein ADM99_01950 [Leptolinea tardivitalis]GAP22659.1 hypothetical protein LTAR_02898 [Leptolinea tardivitalis]
MKCNFPEIDPSLQEKWDLLLQTSPQATLFHSPEWFQMLIETEPEASSVHPFFYENEGNLSGGLILRSTVRRGKKIADLHSCGYNGPLFSPEIHYQETSHTYASFCVFSCLLQDAAKELETIVIENSPDIWNVSPYNFNQWKIVPSYNHIWEKKSEEEAWQAINPLQQEKIRGIENRYHFDEDQSDRRYNELFTRLTLRSELTCGIFKGNVQVLRNRIQWMRDHNLSHLYSLVDQSGNSVETILTVHSPHNGAVYLLCDFSAIRDYTPEILAALYWKTYTHLEDTTRFFDLGKSHSPVCAQLRNDLGCRLVPRFTCKYFAKN